MNESDSIGPARKLNIAESNMFWYLKVFAILSVITAHIYIYSIHGDGAMHWVTSVYASFSTEGVIWFFIMGGFFFSAEDSWLNFIRKKKSMFLAWMVCSLLTYIGCRILPGNYSLTGYIKWTFGYLSWYYYIVVFLSLQVIFFLWQKYLLNKYSLYGCCIITLLSIIFENQYSYHVFFHLTSCLNILNWIGYFALGILLRRGNWIDYLTLKSVFAVSLIGFLMIVFLRIHYAFYDYFNIVAVFDGLFSFVVFLFISKFLAERFSHDSILEIGKETYCIYLLHMPIVQFTAKSIFPHNLFFEIFSPALCLLEMHILILLSKAVCPVKYRSFIFPLVGLKVNNKPKTEDK